MIQLYIIPIAYGGFVVVLGGDDGPTLEPNDGGNSGGFAWTGDG